MAAADFFGVRIWALFWNAERRFVGDEAGRADRSQRKPETVAPLSATFTTGTAMELAL
jgi:hypothetical protein